jgi:myo-inositol 2-dehydrogenase/D-chiro-inositol 1-dehydrogenase
LAIISATRYNGAGYDVRLELLGSEDSISVGLDDRLPLRSAEPGVTWPAGRAYANFLERFRAAYIAELEAFVDVVSGRSPSPCSPADALETFYVAEACELSRRERRPVQMDEVRV